MNDALNTYQKRMAAAAGFVSVLTAFVMAISTSATAIGFALTAILVLLSGLYVPVWRQWLRNPATICLMLSYAVILLGLLYTIGSHHDVSKAVTKYSRFLQAAIILPLFFDVRWRRYAIGAYVAAIVLSVVVSYVHFYIWPFHHRVNLGPASAFKDWIIQSFLFAMGLAIVLHYAVLQRGWRQWLLIALAVFIVFDNLAMSMSRTGYAVTMGVMLYWAWTHLNKRALLGFVAVVLLGLFGVYQVSPTMQQRLHDGWHNAVQYHQQTDDKVENSASFRLEMIKRGIWLFKHRPWIGYGSAAYKRANLIYQNQHPDQPRFDFSSSNTIYLDVMVAYGVMGLVLLLALLITLWLKAAHLPQSERFLMRTMLLAFAVGGCFNSWLSDSTPSHLFVWTIAICFSAFRQSQTFTARADRLK